MTTVHLKYLPISALLTQSIEYLFSVHFPNLSLLDEKFESCTQNKCYKTHCDIMYICVGHLVDSDIFSIRLCCNS